MSKSDPETEPGLAGVYRVVFSVSVVSAIRPSKRART